LLVAAAVVVLKPLQAAAVGLVAVVVLGVYLHKLLVRLQAELLTQLLLAQRVLRGQARQAILAELLGVTLYLTQ
jgi:hypothetical protein